MLFSRWKDPGKETSDVEKLDERESWVILGYTKKTGSCLRRPLCRFVFGYVQSVVARSAKQNFA